MNNPQGFLQALEDGRKCVELDATWSRVRVTRVRVCVCVYHCAWRVQESDVEWIQHSCERTD